MAAFPQEEYIDEKPARVFRSADLYTAVAENRENGQVLGLYILHPNNVAAADTFCNASYAASHGNRGLHIEKSW